MRGSIARSVPFALACLWAVAAISCAEPSQPVFQMRELKTPHGKAWTGLAELPVDSSTTKRFFVVCLLEEPGEAPGLGVDDEGKIVVKRGQISLELPEGSSFLTKGGRLVHLPIAPPETTEDTDAVLRVVDAAVQSASSE